MMLFSSIDTAVGHYRRYSRKELMHKLRQAGFDIQLCTYADSVGFFAWLTTKWQRYDETKKLGSTKSLALYDRWIFPLSRWLDAVGLKYLFGKNIVAIARRI